MSSLIFLAIFQLVLVLVLLAILSKLIAMIKAGAPLISFQRPNWSKPSRRAKNNDLSAKGSHPKERPAQANRMVSFKLPIPGRVREEAPASPDVPRETQAQLGRTRRLLTLSELESASNRAAAHFPEDYYAEVEARLEGLFQDYVSQSITLPVYLDKVRKERSLTQAMLRNGNVLLDPQLRDEAERAAAAIDWCLDWANNQLSIDSEGLAA